MPGEPGHPVVAGLSDQPRASVFTGSSAFADDDDGGQDVSANNELSGKVAIVTGAGRNIGRNIELALAACGDTFVGNEQGHLAAADDVAPEVASLPRT